MKNAAGLLLLLSYSPVVLAQTQWVTATINGDIVSWVWSVTPSSSPAASTPTAATTSPSIVTATQTLVLLPDVTGRSTIPVSTTSISSIAASTNALSSVASESSSSTSAPIPTSTTPLSSSSPSSSIIPQSSSIASFTPNPTSSAAALTLSQATALPSSSAATDNSGTTTPTSKTTNNNTLIKIILGVVLSILAVLILAILLFLCLRRRRRRREAAAGIHTPLDQEKNWPTNTEYLPHSEPTFPMLRATHPSNSQLYMPAPTAALGAHRPRNYSSDALSPLEPDINPFVASSERLDAFKAPDSARGSYRPLETRFPPFQTQHPYYDPTMSELAAAKTSTEYQHQYRPMPISALTSHQNSNTSNNYTSDDSRTSSNMNDHGDLGLVAHNAMHSHDPRVSSPPQQRAMQKRPYATRPPSVITDHSRPYLPRKSSQRSPTSQHHHAPTSSGGGFDFGFGRPAAPATEYRRSSAMSVRSEHEAEQTPMITPPSHDDEDEDEEEERDAFVDEAGTGGMVPLGFSPRSPSVSGPGGLVRGIRRDSLGVALGDRLGSLKRTGSVSVRRSSLSSGSGKRFSIARRPIGGQ